MIGHYTSLADDTQYVNSFLGRVGAVSADHVREAAATWLQPNARAVVSYLVKQEAQPA